MPHSEDFFTPSLGHHNRNNPELFLFSLKSKSYPHTEEDLFFIFLQPFCLQLPAICLVRAGSLCKYYLLPSGSSQKQSSRGSLPHCNQNPVSVWYYGVVAWPGSPQDLAEEQALLLSTAVQSLSLISNTRRILSTERVVFHRVWFVSPYSICVSPRC